MVNLIVLGRHRKSEHTQTAEMPLLKALLEEKDEYIYKLRKPAIMPSTMDSE